MNLALFDFDGTLSTRDSYLLFTSFLGRKRYLFGCLLLSPRIIGYLSGIYPNYALKEDFLRFFFRNKTIDDLRLLAHRFCTEKVPAIIRPGAMERVRWHQDRGDVTAVVSACPRLILEPWCRLIKADLIATELEVDPESRFTGRIEGRNCWGEEKVRRIRSRYELSNFDEIFAYGDSRGDLPMLKMADEDKRFFKPFR
jgi:phosphatidylglycerophosphatase C